MAMTDNDNAAYYVSRAEQEEAAARLTTNSLAVSIHRSLASRYRAKARDFDDGPGLSIVHD